ncbi:MAG: siphovirus Gp157 family protein [Lachnospiraceae bacterium]|nr:siphovirus Gp157 family protein [Lachnospiraceae bacterium]
MSSLYELTEQYEGIRMMLYDGETDEQMILDTLESIDAEIEEKADNYAKIIQDMKSSIEMLKAEEERLKARRKRLEAREDLLKTQLEENMRFIGKTSFKTALFSFNIQSNGGLQPLEIGMIPDIPMRFLVQQEPVPDNKKIREYLKEHEVEWARLLPRGESLRIR